MKIQSIVIFAVTIFSFQNFASCSRIHESDKNKSQANELHTEKQSEVNTKFYDNAIHLDAETLAEQGISEVYNNDMLKVLKKYIPAPSPIEELMNSSTGDYTVVCDGKEYKIFYDGVNRDNGLDWINATFAFFDIVNRQLKSSEYRFYALYGGNDLHGLFLKNEELQVFIKAEKNKKEWPYIPTLTAPWYGQYHN